MYRKGVSALILNNNNEVLLINLNSFEEKFFAIPGGGIEPEETLEEAVYREINEELGIKKDTLVLMGKSDSPIKNDFKEIKLNHGGEQYIGFERYFFGFKFIGDADDIVLNTNEVRSYKWVSIENLGKYLLFENQLTQTKQKIQELFLI